MAKLQVNNRTNVCVVGLGYVGLTLGIYLARHGLRVHGVEIADKILDSLAQRKAHFYETNFDSELEKAIASNLFSYGKDYLPMDGRTHYVITIGTPLGSDNKVNLGALKTAINSIATVIKDDDVVILRSTVKVGTTRDIVKPILDKTGKRFHLGFCPERTLEGSAFAELSSLPQIVSGVDDNALSIIKAFFAAVCRKLVAVERVEEAEMVKLLNNSERDLMFALANEIALMSEAKGLNAYRIIDAANSEYTRSNLKKPGPVGGPCLEKDPYILTEGFTDVDHIPTLFVTGRKVNESIIEKGLRRFFDCYSSKVGNDAPQKIVILGYAFKGNPPTGDVRGSLVYRVTEMIKNRFPYSDIYGHDYIATRKDMRHAGAKIGSNAITEALQDANMIILQNNHPQYNKENWHELAKLVSNNCHIYDFWNQLTTVQTIATFHYSAFGNSQ